MSKNTNNTPNFGESKMLEKTLGDYINPEIQAELDNLEALGIDRDLVLNFKSRVNSLINDDPDVVGIVKGQLDLVTEKGKNIIAEYNGRRQAVYENAMHNNLKNIFGDIAENDEDDIRPYGGTKAA